MWDKILQEEKMNKEMEIEFSKLDKEMSERKKKIVQKWRSGLPNTMRGECNTPEMVALRKEWKERYFKIVEKYKDEE